MKAMILAAGLGTRLAPFTHTQPKVLYPVAGYTLLEITIRYLKKHGVDELVINVHHFADQVVNYLEQNRGFGLRYHISDESGKLMNTGGAIVQARKFLEKEEFFILTGSDILTDLDLSAMIAFHRQQQPLATLAVKDRPTSRSLLFDREYRLTGWRDNQSGDTKGKPEHADHALGFSVIHVIDPQIFRLIEEQGAFSITDLYLRLMHSYKILGYRHDRDGWIEFGRLDRIAGILENDEFRRMIQRI